MIASQPVRLVSLVIMAVVIVVGIRGIFSGITVGSDRLDERGRGDRDTGLSAHGPRSTVKRTRGSVAYVLDGDTVQVTTSDGGSVRVRFLGISAPEVPHPGKPGECFGYPATRHLKQLLPAGTQVTLVSDPTQDDTDVYGRSLRYVQAGGRDIGAAQIRAGSAAARDSSSPIARYATYVELERQAQHQRLGMWSACH